MHRREFIESAAVLLLASARRLRADHEIISINPLIVVSDLSTLEGRYTRIEDFYVRSHFNAPPIVKPASLRIEGEVEKSQLISADALAGFPLRRIGAVLECAGDPTRVVSLVSDGVWQGWALRDVLELTRPLPTGKYLHLFGRDGFSRSIPMSRALNDGFLVTSLNGAALTRNHGAPWRALFPGWYGMDSVKWLDKIVVASDPLPMKDFTYVEVTRSLFGGAYVGSLPPIQVKSVITAPADGAVLHRGRAQVSGLAWSGMGQITSVDVRAGTERGWRSAVLDRSASSRDWVLWNVSFFLESPGVVEFVSKATDSAGNVQPEERDPARVDRYAYNVCQTIRCRVI